MLTFARAIVLASLHHSAVGAWAEPAAHPVDLGISSSAAEALQAHGFTSAADAAALGLSSTDLVAMGIERVSDRIAILKATKAMEQSTTIAVPIDGDDAVHDNIQLSEEFSFALTYVNSTRQYGKCLHQIVKYRYPYTGTPSSYIDYIDYRPIYEEAMGYLTQPTEELPTDVQWEVINNAFVTWLLGAYNMTAASSQIMVMASSVPEIYEPGNHGSTVTAGAGGGAVPAGFVGLAESWTNAFAFDCTKHANPRPH